MTVSSKTAVLPTCQACLNSDTNPAKQVWCSCWGTNVGKLGLNPNLFVVIESVVC